MAVTRVDIAGKPIFIWNKANIQGSQANVLREKNNIMRRSIILILLLNFALNNINAQLLLDADTDPSLLNSHWDASWVTVPDADLNSYGVYFFRNAINLDQVPEKFIVHISADNRYKLYGNGKLV